MSSKHHQFESPQRYSGIERGATAWFRVIAADGTARAGEMHLASGSVSTPVFMPVGTQAAVKALDADDLKTLDAEIILANTYHLMLRPGGDLIERRGGVGSFMNWNRPILTDSGGFQVFSLARNRRLSLDGVTFHSHLDGREHLLTPESAIQLQRQFKSDIVMALDVCAGFGVPESEQADAFTLTHRWLPRAIDAFLSGSQDLNDPLRSRLFGISQGGFSTDRRRASAREIASSSVDGCAIGGLSVGEPKDVLSEMLAASIGELPVDRPRYLMGVGSPEDLWNCVALGVDMFDCVLPTRAARHGGIYTTAGRVNVRSSAFRERDDPIDATCDCYTCRTTSAAYLHHLFRTRELSAFRLASIHNLRFVIRQTEQMRAAIRAGTFAAARREFLEGYQAVDEQVREAQRGKYRWAGERRSS